jgi:hypothetical protein
MRTNLPPDQAPLASKAETKAAAVRKNVQDVPRSATHTRAIFRTGEFMDYFRPDEEHTLFRTIYDRKRVEVLKLTRELLGDNSNARVAGCGSRHWAKRSPQTSTSQCADVKPL